MPLKTYYPGKVKRSKGELNIQSKYRENENSITHFKSSVEGIKHTAMI